jgi:DNA-binding NtrC family response regulator
MIFVVDDDDRIRSMTAAALRDMGHEVRDFSNGADALRAMASEPAALILSDVQMPEMSGPEFVSAALLVQPDVQVLYMSGDIGDIAPERLAPWPLLAKPFTTAALRRAVTQLGGFT